MTELNWDVFANLGIPGLALGVFYMLFRKYNWHFPTVPRSWTGPIIIMVIVAITGVVVLAMLLWAPASPRETIPVQGKAQNNPAKPSINYMRLFGAYQVPWVIQSLYVSNAESDESILPISSVLGENEPLYKFWESWEYAKSKPLKTKLWEEYLRLDSFDLLCIAINDDKKALDYLSIIDFHRQNIGEVGEADFEGVLKKEFSEVAVRAKALPFTNEKYMRMHKYIEKQSQNIGFLFLIIENTTDKIFEDVTINYKDYSNKNKAHRDNNIQYGCSYDKIDTSKFPSASEAEAALLGEANEKHKTLYQLKPKDSIMLILEIYIKDKQGYPQKYISDITKPISLTYREATSNTKTALDIRGPLRDQAAQILVPLGWYGQ